MTIKSYKNYLQNTQHRVLRNRPTLSIGTERLACLNSPPPPGVQLFSHLPQQPRIIRDYFCLQNNILFVCVFKFICSPYIFISYNPNTMTIKSYKNYLQNTQHRVLRNRPTLSIGTERLACLNSPPPPGVQLFSHLPQQPRKSVRVIVHYWLGV